MHASLFEIDDSATFETNLNKFIESLAAHDATLAAVARSELPKLLRGELDKAQFWDALYNATKPDGPS